MEKLLKNKDTELKDILNHYVQKPSSIPHIHIAGSQSEPPILAYQVGFKRIEIIVSGEISMQLGGCKGDSREVVFKEGDLLYVPENHWNKPDFDKPCISLNILCGKQNFGLSLLKWDGNKFDLQLKSQVERRGSRVGSFILFALEECETGLIDQNTMRLLFTALLGHIAQLLEHPLTPPSKSKALYEGVRDYIETNYNQPLTRKSVADHFYVSSNYLSQLFQREGNLGFNEYLNHVRLEKAKFLLKEYDMKIKEIAMRCGFNDSNYFCRIFKSHTDRSPSEYRRHFHSDE